MHQGHLGRRVLKATGMKANRRASARQDIDVDYERVHVAPTWLSSGKAPLRTLHCLAAFVALAISAPALAADLPPEQLAVVAAPSGAMAESSSIGVSFTSDRKEQNLGDPQSTKFEINASHIFDTGIALGTSAEYSDTAFSKSATLNLEATLGYRFHFNDALSMIGSIGIGERLQVSGEGNNIPYYVLRIGADLKLTKIVTWHVVAFRYRDGFDSSDDYLTPQLATGFSFKVGDRDTISSKIQYNWKDWDPSSVGFSLGYSRSF
jgi:hypothetical protein